MIARICTPYTQREIDIIKKYYPDNGVEYVVNVLVKNGFKKRSKNGIMWVRAKYEINRKKKEVTVDLRMINNYAKKTVLIYGSKYDIQEVKKHLANMGYHLSVKQINAIKNSK